MNEISKLDTLLDTSSTTVGQIIKKTPGQKNLWNQINQFHEIFLLPKSIFCIFKNGQKSIFELGKSLKLPKM